MFGLSTIKLYAGAAGLVAIVAAVVGLWLYVASLRHANATLTADKAAAVAEARAAGAQGNVTTAAATAADTASTKEVHITVQAEEAARVVQQAPGASDALPASGLASWRSGVLGVRTQDAAAGVAGRAGGTQPARAVPAS